MSCCMIGYVLLDSYQFGYLSKAFVYLGIAA